MKRFILKIKAILIVAFNQLKKIFAPLERRYINNSNINTPPIFIIGPARSGTTLIYQVFTTSLNLTYFNNLMDKFPYSPTFINSVFKKRDGKIKAENKYLSSYGKTSGNYSPSQGVSIWNRWFPQYDAFSSKKVLTSEEQKKLRNTIAKLEQQYNDIPFINKWNGHNVHLLALYKVFPSAIFIRVKRDPLMNAQSILNGRYELKGDPYKNITRNPTRYMFYEGKHYTTQVCGYMNEVNNDIDEYEKIIGDRFFEIQYEDFCNNPEFYINQFVKFYQYKTGIELNLISNPPINFKVSNKRKISSEDFNKLREELKTDRGIK